METSDLISKETLYTLYIDKKMSDSEIAKIYNLTLGQINRLRRKYNIKSIEQYERWNKNQLTEQETRLILGLLLGDGHMRWRSGKKTYPQLCIEQSVKHREYIYWLYENLKDWTSNSEKPIHTNRHQGRNGKNYHSLSFQTICHPAFIPLYENFYDEDGRKRLNINFIKENFDLSSLAIWVMDDGCLTGKTKRNNLATNSFSLNEVNQLRNFLLEKYKLKSWLVRRTTPDTISYEISFDKKSSELIRDYLQDFIIDSMKYKLLPLSSETTKDTEKFPKV